MGKLSASYEHPVPFAKRQSLCALLGSQKYSATDSHVFEYSPNLVGRSIGSGGSWINSRSGAATDPVSSSEISLVVRAHGLPSPASSRRTQCKAGD